MKETAKLISTQAEVLSKEPELVARQSGRTLHQRLRDGTMNLRHPGNDHVRVPTLRAICYFDALENDVRKAAFGVSVTATLRGNLFPAVCAYVDSRSTHEVLSKTMMNTAIPGLKVKTIATCRRSAVIPSILYFH